MPHSLFIGISLSPSFALSCEFDVDYGNLLYVLLPRAQWNMSIDISHLICGPFRAQFAEVHYGIVRYVAVECVSPWYRFSLSHFHGTWEHTKSLVTSVSRFYSSQFEYMDTEHS